MAAQSTLDIHDFADFENELGIERSLSMKIMDLCDELEYAGEHVWASLLHSGYFTGLGVDGLDGAINVLRSIEASSDLIDQLVMTDRIQQLYRY